MLISCYCLVTDTVLYRNYLLLSIQYLVSDVVSVITGLFFCYVGFFTRSEGENTLLQEPLLNGNSNVSDDVGSRIKSRGADNVTPYSTAGLFSLFTFSWMGSLIAVGYKKTLDLEDVPQLDRHDSVVEAFPIFRSKLEADGGVGSGVTTLKLVKALILSTWKEILLTGFLILLHTMATYVGPHLIGTFVQYLTRRREFKNEGYVLVSAFLVAKFVENFSEIHYFFWLQQVGIRIRAVLVVMVYNKGLTLSCQAKQERTSGEIINFMTVDAERVGDFSWSMHDAWIVLLQVFLALFILYRNLGLASIATFLAIIIAMVPNFPLGRLQNRFQVKLMESKDTRMKATSEILRNMRILKLQGWEMKFLSKIAELRMGEAGWLKKYLYTSAMTSFVFWGAPTFVSVATFGACMLLGIPLESSKILSALATLRILQQPIQNLPDTISTIIQTKVSLDRIASFLSLDDLKADVMEKQPTGSSDKAIDIADANFSWDVSSPNQTLRDINLKVFHGMRVAVCGTVGSGKSSLLSCILGEVPKISGNLKLCGTKAYVAQSPWIQSGKIEDNILFVEFLPAADLILVMKDGKIIQSGKYSGILNSGTDFMELMGAHKQALSALESIDEHKDIQNDKAEEVAEAKGQLVQEEEEREKGRVGFWVYWKFITTAYGGALVPFILLAQILFQALQIGSNYWMALATPVSEDAKQPVGGFTLITVYVALAIGSSFCILCRATLLATAGYKTASVLFNKMHLCIFRAPMAFFEATPSGRILNRASTDQSAVDLNIPSRVGSLAFSIIQLLGIIIVMSQVAWQVFLVFIPVIVSSIWYQQYYLPSARELSRLVGVCKAPVIQHFAETISGSTTIRSFDQESRFRDTNMKLMDGYSRPNFQSAAAMQWLCFRLNMLSSITFAFSLIFLISIPKGVIDPAIAGLAVTYGLSLNTLQIYFIYNLCNLENKIISVERILQYTCTPSEPPLVIEESRPYWCWPSYGEVYIRDLQVRYASHLPLVLRGLTCSFPGGMKTGIVGRTGSGKSTLIQTLFRIVEPAAGQIMIDGINISSIGLHDLRSRLSIIPQDPTMFEGTVRSNLDPLEEYTDEQIWEALDKCQLGDEVRKKEEKLDSKVTENGDNWSMGQRQLVCLGRVLLKKSKVLVLDEATASVDTATDNLIQQTLRLHFSDCTVITVAHRITSVIDSNMVLLLNHGLIEEYDSPWKLLGNKSSSFCSACCRVHCEIEFQFRELNLNMKAKP
ncbi:hypothetical protein Pint_03906 [Pistacia integerrima]|uniref:Uncharacterized protein n=1 Tax=Pistacia integerrima TaxID=434235 RepID=A0ACC0Z602_9ROSI|nr:hypothetical protein Pint_03906 [Pistacia integerrima]